MRFPQAGLQALRRRGGTRGPGASVHLTAACLEGRVQHSRDHTLLARSTLALRLANARRSQRGRASGARGRTGPPLGCAGASPQQRHLTEPCTAPHGTKQPTEANRSPRGDHGQHNHITPMPDRTILLEGNRHGKQSGKHGARRLHHNRSHRTEAKRSRKVCASALWTGSLKDDKRALLVRPQAIKTQLVLGS